MKSFRAQVSGTRLILTGLDDDSTNFHSVSAFNTVLIGENNKLSLAES